MKSIILSICLILSFFNTVRAQLDDYKYIVVPKKFNGFSKVNQYKTSTLIKYLFVQKGFNAVYDDNLPDDLQANRCLALFVDLKNKSSMFTTKATLVLKDCSNVDIFSSMEGRSKKKDYEASFAEAIENAFGSFDGMTHSYKPKAQEAIQEPVTVSFKNDVKKPEENPASMENNSSTLIEQESTKEKQFYKDKRPVISDYKKAENTMAKTVRQVATEEEQSFESMEPKTSSEYALSNASANESTASLKTGISVLYAQELSNGYQLVDSTPKIRMKLLKSTSPNIYIAESGTINGVVYTENGKWFFEYYNANELVKEELNIKF